MAYLYNYCEEESQETISPQEFTHAKDHLIGVLENIYKAGNIDALQNHLEEVCHVFGLKLPEISPVLDTKPTPEKTQTERMLQHWVGYTRAYAEFLCKPSKK